MVQITVNDGTEILTRLWNNVIKTGLVPRRLDSSRLGLLLSAIATEFNVTISILQSYVNQFNMNTCTDKVLIENMARMFAVRRLASKSKVVLTFYRLNGFNESIKIPANFSVKCSTNQTIIFKTVSDVFLWKGTESVSVLAYSIGSGRQYNVDANTLTQYETNNYNTKIGVTNSSPSFGGRNDETIEHLRNRAKGFRYERDGTLTGITRKLWMLGVSDNNYLISEYADGPGSYLLCLDCESDEEFNDLCSSIAYGKTAGVKQIFTRAERLYLNIYVHITTVGESDYTPLMKENIYNQVNTTVQQFFAATCWVGASFRKERLKSDLLRSLSNYNISEIEIDFDNGVAVNKQGVVSISDMQKLYPNKILTNLEFKGD